MPTQNPRITVTLKPSTFAQLREVSRLTGNSQSALIGEMLEQAEPVFSRLIQVLSAAEQAKQDLKAKAVSDLEQAQAMIEKQMGLFLGEFDGIADTFLSGVEEVRSTPLSNRGVRSTANPGKPAKAKGLN